MRMSGMVGCFMENEEVEVCNRGSARSHYFLKTATLIQSWMWMYNEQHSNNEKNITDAMRHTTTRLTPFINRYRLAAAYSNSVHC
jgi:hypothetical protein